MRQTLAAIALSLLALAPSVPPRAWAEPPASASVTSPRAAEKDAPGGHSPSLAFESAGRGVVTAKPGHDFAVASLSAPGVFDSEAVFVGYGIVDEARRYNSYRAMPEGMLKGKVAIAFNYEPQTRDGDSRWAEGAAGASREGARKMIESGPAGRMGRGGAGPWSPACSVLKKARWAAERGAVALLLVDGPAQDIAEPVSAAAARLAEPGRAPIPVIHVRSLFFRSLLKRGGGGKEVDAIIEAFENDANKDDGSLNDETGVEALRDVRLWGAIVPASENK